MDHSITIEENPVHLEHSITIEENPVRISKVHIGLRNVKPKAYKPVLVSIGPYHKADPDLQAMQQNKNLYLNSLLERRNKSLEQRNQSLESRKIYLAKLAELNSEARKCYVDPYPVNSNDEFVEMMLLDSCFIVEFLRKMDNVVKFDKDDPISKLDWMQDQIQSDMMLLENQLPYFFLSEVYNMTKSVGEKPLEEMVMSCFNIMLPRPRLNSNNAFGNNTGEINHLLHLIHIFCRPFPKNNEDSNSGSAKNQGIEGSSGDQTCCPLLPQNSDSDESNEMTNQMGTVVELQEAGVEFEKVGKIYNGKLKKKTEKKEDYVSLFDIGFEYKEWTVPCFKRGVMKVPCFKVDDGTETLLRNLIAYEQEQHFPNDPMYFTDFACLMNQLINTEKDAKVLRFEGIIMNLLGDDDELSRLFNRLTDGVFESENPYYPEVRQKVDNHCKTNCTVMTKLRRYYFNNPWAGISTVSTALLLYFTVVQTIVALKTVSAT